MKIFQFTKIQNHYNEHFTYLFGIYEEVNENTLILKLIRPKVSTTRIYTEQWNISELETGRIQYVF